MSGRGKKFADIDESVHSPKTPACSFIDSNEVITRLRLGGVGTSDNAVIEELITVGRLPIFEIKVNWPDDAPPPDSVTVQVLEEAQAKPKATVQIQVRG